MSGRPPGVVLRDVEVSGRRVDVRVTGGAVAEMAPRLAVDSAVEVIDGAGGALVPGLHDHHIHLLALAAARASVQVGPPEVTDHQQMVAALRRADAALPPGAWIRAVGYHEQVAGSLDRHVLDAVLPARPLRVQHRSGGLWVLNSPAVAAVGLDGTDGPPGVDRDDDGQVTGRLFRLDEWLAGRLPSPGELDLAAVGAELAAHGVTGVTDATPVETAAGIRPIAAAVTSGALPQHVVVTGGPNLEPQAAVPLRRGPVKLLLHDHDLPPLDAVVEWIAAAHISGRPVAVHCVTRLALVLTVAALETAGVAEGDRIEHGAVIPVEVVPTLRGLGTTVVTQPAFVAARGDDYLAEVDPEDQVDLWRCGTLLAAGVGVAGSTDAPFGDANPWRAIAAAIERRTAGGRLLGVRERLPGPQALDLFLAPLDCPSGPARAVRVGAPADLCLLAEPLEVSLRAPAQAQVVATLIAGELRHRSP